ncbi:MAG: type VI secretion system baseplate subunit TssG [Rubinisphaera brasiliensis]|uniref:type VI secretion system baseplate subunit TssG n=1 Tax=Rubinisphaera brasiliensis TaxID=119 RepID=UPI00391C1F68
MMSRILEFARKCHLFQAVRLIQLQTLRENEPQRRAPQLGSDTSPDNEPLLFAAVAKARFAGTEIESIGMESVGGRSRQRGRYKLETSAIGLTGPSGALPRHYTSLLLMRQKKHDYAMARFFDLFNHRVTALFYRAWGKHRLPICYESAAVNPRVTDTPTDLLNCLVGQGVPQLRGRAQYPDQTLLMFAGLFSSVRRSAAGLQTILQTVLNAPVEVQQFCPHWLNLEPSERTRLGSGTAGRPAHNQLGRSAICGERVFDLQSRFRITIQTRDYREFLSFLPERTKLTCVSELTRRFVGMEFDFDVQVVVPGKDVPVARLGTAAMQTTGTNKRVEQSEPPRLGRNAWLRSDPMAGRVGDAVFAVDEAA